MSQTGTNAKEPSLYATLITAVDDLLIPPFKGASIVVFAIFVLFAMMMLDGPINLSDPDHYLYLIRAIDWLNGQDWYDHFLYRMNPPQGTFIHYSPILIAAYACFIFLLQPLLGTLSAALTSALFVPLLFLALYILTLRRLAQMLVDKNWGDFPAYIILFSPFIMFRFLPGQMDHHGLEALIAILALSFMARMILRPSEFIWAAAAGVLLALGLALALEILAVVILFCVCLGAWAVIEGGAAARSGFVFGLVLVLCSFGFLLLTRSPQHIFDTDVLAYSIVYVILTEGVALCFAGVALTGEKSSMLLRGCVGFGLALATGALFFHAFPALVGGPYGGMNPDLAKLIFINAPEAWSVLHMTPMTQVMTLLGPITALGATAYVLIHESKRTHRWIWGMIAFVLSACLGLAVFYQCRFMSYVATFAALPLTAMVCHDWTHRMDFVSSKRIFSTVRCALFLFVCPITAVWPISYDYPSMGVPTPPVAVAKPNSKGCDMHHLAEKLNDKHGYGNRPRTIINTINEGTEIMMRTPHNVLSGPYHTNVTGNLDALRFFTTPNPDEARTIAEQRKADLIVICNMPGQLLAYTYLNNDAGSGKQTFVQQLIGGQTPDWVKPVPLPSTEEFLLFEILLPEAKKS